MMGSGVFWADGHHQVTGHPDLQSPGEELCLEAAAGVS